MTATRWEYASVIWTEAIRKITKADPEFERLSAEVQAEWARKDWSYSWWKVQTYYIWLPGDVEADTRTAWETGDDKYKVNFLDILNELGADGWEVATNVVRSTAMGPSLGRETTGFPIQSQTLLKRQVAA